MGANAARAALADAGLDYAKVEQAYVGYVYGDSTSGQATLYHLGLSGIPVVNVNNNCSTGSSALWLARQAVASGVAECVLALGFEQMRPGALAAVWDDRPSSTGKFEEVALGQPRSRSAGADGRAALRRRGRRAHGALRHQTRDVRPHLGEGAPARRPQPARGVPRHRSPSTR